MDTNDLNVSEELRSKIDALGRRLRVLTIAVILLTLAALLLTMSVYGSLVNYFSTDALLFGGATVGAALLGFGFGWFARRRA